MSVTGRRAVTMTTLNTDSTGDEMGYPNIYMRDAVVCLQYPFDNIVKALKTSGEIKLTHYSHTGHGFEPGWIGGVSLSWTVKKVIVHHATPPRPDQTAFYDLTLHIRPTNAERIALLRLLRKFTISMAGFCAF